MFALDKQTNVCYNMSVEGRGYFYALSKQQMLFKRGWHGRKERILRL